MYDCCDCCDCIAKTIFFIFCSFIYLYVYNERIFEDWLVGLLFVVVLVAIGSEIIYHFVCV